ncbi:uncharacterized protein LOC142344856 isoform X2 [Convolutriloba macropyga]|uniref:uncharacterized protein LOC142344856 isoform X2 n=1 Tax=Convolutriloba macropyga TaxID=536237 RepID=UPI003F51EDD8
MAFFSKELFEEYSTSQIYLEIKYKQQIKIVEENKKSQLEQNQRSSKKRPQSSETSNATGKAKKAPNSAEESVFYTESGNNFLQYKYEHPASWYRSLETRYAKVLNDVHYHENQVSKIGAASHELYLRLFPKHQNRSPFEPNLSPGEKSEREELLRLTELISNEQQRCQKFYEKVASSKRRELYCNFAQSIPSLFTHVLRLRILAVIEKLPPIYVRDFDFDFSQMVFRSTDPLSFQSAIVLENQSQLPVMQATVIHEPPLCEQTFRCPIILDKPNFFNQMLLKRGNTLPIRSSCILSEEQIVHFYSKQKFVTEKIEAICVIDVDILAVLASCSVVYDMEINLPFRKQFCPDLKKPIVTFDTEVIPVYYYPPRLHCSEALKALFEHRFSSTAASEKPSSSYNVKQEHVDSEKCGLVYVNTLCGMTNGISFVVGVHKPIWTDIINNNGYQNPGGPASSGLNSGNDQQKQQMFYVFKREMQCEFGLEELSPEEVVRIVILLNLFPNSKVVLVRVDSNCSCILHVTDYAIGSEQLRNLLVKLNFNVQAVLNKLLQLVNKLAKLETDAHYLLRRSGFTSKCEIFIQSNLSKAPDLTQRPTINLKQVYQQSLNLIPAELVTWLPIDTTKIMPFHFSLKRIPATFFVSLAGSSTVFNRRRPPPADGDSGSSEMRSKKKKKKKSKSKGKQQGKP